MPLLWLGLSLIAGIFVSAQIQGFWGLWAILFFSGLLLSCFEYYFSKRHSHPLLSKKLFSIPIGLLIAAFAIGGWRFQSILPNPTINDLAYYQPIENALVTGTITSFPELSPQSSVAILEAESFIDPGSGKVGLWKAGTAPAGWLSSGLWRSAGLGRIDQTRPFKRRACPFVLSRAKGHPDPHGISADHPPGAGLR